MLIREILTSKDLWLTLLFSIPWYFFIILCLEIDTLFMRIFFTMFGTWLFCTMHYKTIMFVLCIFTLVDLFIFFSTPSWYDIVFNPVQKL